MVLISYLLDVDVFSK